MNAMDVSRPKFLFSPSPTRAIRRDVCLAVGGGLGLAMIAGVGVPLAVALKLELRSRRLRALRAAPERRGRVASALRGLHVAA